MYERFTDRAKKVMQLAEKESRELSHNYVGTGHILLGLLKEGSGVAANVMKNLGMNLGEVRGEILLMLGESDKPPLEIKENYSVDEKPMRSADDAAKAEEESLKVGDVVELKANGSRFMVVSKAYDGDREVTCLWLDYQGQLQTGVIPVAVLRKVQTDDMD